MFVNDYVIVKFWGIIPRPVRLIAAVKNTVQLAALAAALETMQTA